MTVEAEEVAKVLDGEAEEIRENIDQIEADPTDFLAVADQLEHVAERLRDEEVVE